MGAHLIGGEFQSDKYPTCPRGKVPLSVKDRTAQDLLWEYAQRRRAVDAEFAEDLEAALTRAGYAPCRRCVDCDGSPHHWIEDPPAHNGATDWACRHCEARGIFCPSCDGDVEEQVGCELCGGDGVVEVLDRTVFAAPTEEFPGWIIGNAAETEWRRWGDAGPEWTPHRDQALRFARRGDAEAFAAEDDDAWKLVRHPPVDETRQRDIDEIAAVRRRARAAEEDWQAAVAERDHLRAENRDLRERDTAPVPLLLYCPRCAVQHVDAPQPEKGWTNPPHRSHECQACGYVWRPADVATIGVARIDTRGQRDQSAKPWSEYDRAMEATGGPAGGVTVPVRNPHATE